jgi:hypothetical protein
VVVASGVAVRPMRRRVHDHGLRRRRRRRRLGVLGRLLVLDFLHLQDVGVADLPAQAAGQPDRVDVVADHLQLLPGDRHRYHPCTHTRRAPLAAGAPMGDHLFVCVCVCVGTGRSRTSRRRPTTYIPFAPAASVMALVRLLSHGMLTLITIFCCARRPPQDAEARERERETACR